MLSRRSFLRLLGVGVVAAPVLVRGALRPDRRMTATEIMRRERERFPLLTVPPHYESRFEEYWRELMIRQDGHALAAARVQDFMGFKFIRTDITPKRLSSAQIRKDIEFGRTLDQRISDRWYQVPTYAPQTFTWIQGKPLVYVADDFQRELNKLVDPVEQVTSEVFNQVRSALMS